MSRGLGRLERHILAVATEWTEAEAHPSWRWVPMDALTETGTRAEREALRRAANSLHRKGLVEIGATSYTRWLLWRRWGGNPHHDFHAEGVERPHVRANGYGDRGSQLVVRLPITSDADRAIEAQEAEKEHVKLQVAMAMLRGA